MAANKHHPILTVPFYGENGVELNVSADKKSLIDDSGNVRYQSQSGVFALNEEEYASNFGDQWNEFGDTQLDSQTGDDLSEQRLFLSLDMEPQDLAGKYVLEAGSGAGRFTEILLKYGAIVYSFDASKAVFANLRNNDHENLILFQSSIYEIPLAQNSFDIVLCLGVLQHTPDRLKTVTQLAKFAKPGGIVCVDSYPWRAAIRLSVPYLLRPLISQVPAKFNRKTAEAWVALWWPFRKILQNNTIRRVASFFSPILIFYYYNVSSNKQDDYLRAWAVLDTHDFITPKYDSAQTLSSLRKLFLVAGLTSIVAEDLRKKRTEDGRVVSGFLVARGVKA